jgi:hypothetical protein
VQILASVAVAEALGRDGDVTVGETNLGHIALSADDLDEARLRFESALHWHRRNGTEPTFALIGLAHVARRQGLLDEADAHVAEARELAVRSGRPHNAVLAMLVQAAVATDRGQADTAGRLLGRVAATAAATIGGLVGTERDEYLQVEAAVLAAVGRDALDELLRQGREEAT